MRWQNGLHGLHLRSYSKIPDSFHAQTRKIDEELKPVSTETDTPRPSKKQRRQAPRDLITAGDDDQDTVSEDSPPPVKNPLLVQIESSLTYLSRRTELTLVDLLAKLTTKENLEQERMNTRAAQADTLQRLYKKCPWTINLLPRTPTCVNQYIILLKK